MSDWFGYAPSDVLMFGPEVYWRLFELHNTALWPIPVVALVAGVTVLILAATGRAGHPLVRIATALGWAGAAHFLATRYAPINWPVGYVTWAFGAQAVLLIAFTGWGRARSATSTTGLPSRLGLALLAYAVLLHPVLGLPFGRPVTQAEIVGLAPDPTALATLGLLLLLARSIRTDVLALLPLVWCLASAATLLTLDQPQGWVLAALPVAWLIARVSQPSR